MPHQRQTLGALGEKVAQEYLERLGYKKVAQNWHAGRYGEIDLIMIDGNELVFVEVKTRASADFGYPEQAVNIFKQKKLIGAAQAFLSQHPQLPTIPRFDVIAILLSTGNKITDIKHYKRLIFG